MIRAEARLHESVWPLGAAPGAQTHPPLVRYSFQIQSRDHAEHRAGATARQQAHPRWTVSEPGRTAFQARGQLAALLRTLDGVSVQPRLVLEKPPQRRRDLPMLVPVGPGRYRARTGVFGAAIRQVPRCCRVRSKLGFRLVRDIMLPQRGREHYRTLSHRKLPKARAVIVILCVNPFLNP